MRKIALLILVWASNLLAAAPIDPSGLYFREDFRVLPAATPITNQSLRLHLYGAGAETVKKSHHEEKADDPFYVWSGQCARPWAIAFRKADAPAARTGGAVSLGCLEFSTDALFHFENAGRLDGERSRRGAKHQLDHLDTPTHRLALEPFRHSASPTNLPASISRR
jgi:hypothetical protein